MASVDQASVGTAVGEAGAAEGTSARPRTYGPRERMVFSAAQLIRRDGVNATGMREVAAHAGAPRGSLQHYFPGGKEQLVNEAVTWAAVTPPAGSTASSPPCPSRRRARCSPR